jgi:hypothetical protein
MVSVGTLATICFGGAFSQHAYVWISAAAGGVLLILGRTAAHHTPLEKRDFGRRACTVFYIGASIIQCAMDTNDILLGVVDMSTWIGYLATYVLFSLAAPLLTLTFALDVWVYLLVIALPLLPPSASIVMRAPVPPDQLTSVQQTAAMSLLMSWVIGIVCYFLGDAIFRDHFVLASKHRSLAEAKSRCVLRCRRATHRARAHAPTTGGARAQLHRRDQPRLQHANCDSAHALCRD